MTEKTLQIPLKNRSDIIDTVLQHQQEAKALKFLLILLLGTICYECNEMVFEWLFGGSGEIAQPAERIGKRTIPIKRAQRLLKAVADFGSRVPQAGVLLRPWVEKILPPEKPESSGEARRCDIEEMKKPVTEIFTIAKNPLWDAEDKSLQAILEEAASLLKLMKAPVPTEIDPPPLSPGPRLLQDFDIPTRDLFTFPRAGTENASPANK